MEFLQQPFNQLDPEVDVGHLRVDVHLLEQHVAVQHDLVQEMPEKFLVPDFVALSFTRIAGKHLVRQIHCTHLLVVVLDGVRFFSFCSR